MKKITLLLPALLLSACSAATPTPLPTPFADQANLEEQAVYAAVLQQLYAAPAYVFMDGTAFDISDTSIDETLQRVTADIHELAPETVADFRARNETTRILSADMTVGAPYSLLNQNDRRLLFDQNQDGWQLFYERYPDAPGITALSRVGFNDRFDQALVYVGTQSHWLAGAGYYLLLTKADGVWQVERKTMVWIS